jgi:hypothetical protein
VLAVCGQDSPNRFLVNELVIPGRITIYPMDSKCWQSAAKYPPDGNKSRIPYSEGSIPHKHSFLKF